MTLSYPLFGYTLLFNYLKTMMLAENTLHTKCVLYSTTSVRNTDHSNKYLFSNSQYVHRNASKISVTVLILTK